jgi:hypothetical protein
MVFTVGFQVRFRDTVLRKLPLPLKRSLKQLEQGKLTFEQDGKNFAYRLEGPPIEFHPEMLDMLGTRDYLAWNLRLWDDTENRQTEQAFQFVVTYYTGKPDQVPHVAEECMLGNGFKPSGNQGAELELPGLPEKDRRVPLQVLLFRRRTMTSGEDCRLVMYTFRVCDQWHAERDGVRLTLGNPLAEYAYFSKVELSFPLPAGMPPEAVKKAIEAGKRFLQTALPVLVQDHWPNWPEGGRMAASTSLEKDNSSDGETLK